jgi:hypothetical protein
LHNYAVNGANEIHTQNTVGGNTTFQNVTLRSKTGQRFVITSDGRDREGEWITVVTPPNLTVSKDSYDTVRRNLL